VRPYQGATVGTLGVGLSDAISRSVAQAADVVRETIAELGFDPG
jgi:hypothetical protein